MTNGLIRVGKDRNVGVHLSICQMCGKEVGVVLMGDDKDFYVDCSKCGMRHYGGSETGSCKGCDTTLNNSTSERRKMESWDKVPCEICDECKERINKCDAEVEKGGVYWKCKDCKSNGALTAKSEMAKAVRKTMEILEGKCGIEFDKKTCPVCTVQKQEKGDESD